MGFGKNHFKMIAINSLLKFVIQKFSNMKVVCCN